MIVTAEFASRGGISLTITGLIPDESNRARTMKRAVVLLSGGLDSATTLAICRADGFESYALSFRYGQRHERELVAAREDRKVVRRDRTSHRPNRPARLRRIGPDRRLGSSESALRDRKWRAAFPSPMSRRGTRFFFPTRWPGRRCSARLIFSSARTRLITAGTLIAGRNLFALLSSLANLATQAGVEGARFAIHAPLLTLSKAEIIQRGLSLGVDYSLTHSCYDPTSGGLACGACDSCQLRLKGFREAGLTDPITYAP